MCDGCPLQTIADVWPGAWTRVEIFHPKKGEDVVQVSVVTYGQDPVVAIGKTCREAVAALLRMMDSRRNDNR